MPGLVALTVFDRITDFVSGSPWTYGITFAVTGLDAFFPLVPSEAVVITAGTQAASGHLIVYLVILAVALGAFAGDNVSYGLGALFGERAAEHVLSGDKGRRRLKWAQRMLDRHGALIIVVARFIPGGRTATTFAAGTLDLTWRRFAAYDAVAVTIWAVYATMIGYAGGETFRKETWKALLLGFGVALAISVGLEVLRRVQARRGRDVLGARERSA